MLLDKISPLVETRSEKESSVTLVAGAEGLEPSTYGFGVQYRVISSFVETIANTLYKAIFMFVSFQIYPNFSRFFGLCVTKV